MLLIYMPESLPSKLHRELSLDFFFPFRPAVQKLSLPRGPKQAEGTYIGMLLGTKLLRAATKSAYPQS